MTTRAELILRLAKRTRDPKGVRAVANAVHKESKRAESEADLEMLEEALSIAQSVMDAYEEERVVPIGRRRHG